MYSSNQSLSFKNLNHKKLGQKLIAFSSSPERKIPVMKKQEQIPQRWEMKTNKISSSIKTLGAKIDGVQEILRRNSDKFDKIVKVNRQQNNANASNTEQKIPQPLSLMPKLRNTCPNIIKNIQQISLRSTLHSNNSQRIGNFVKQTQKKYIVKQDKNQKLQNYTPKSSYITPKLAAKVSSCTELKPDNIQKVRKSLILFPHKVSENKNIVNGFYLLKKIGQGKFGIVYLGRHLQTGFLVALKKIEKSKIVQYKMEEQFRRQITIHNSLEHPNITKFYGYFQDKNSVYTVLEYLCEGTLFDYLVEKDRLSPKETAIYLTQIIAAVSFMHQRMISHRDIKPENILLGKGRVSKLCDFGWSAIFQTKRNTYCGTLAYVPPEILEGKDYDIAIDVWGIGVLTYEMLIGRAPFQGEKRKQVSDKILNVDKIKLEYPVNIPEEAKNFIELAMQKDPTRRPKCKDLLSHPYFKKYEEKNKF